MKEMEERIIKGISNQIEEVNFKVLELKVK
jgi:hypothetical protein